MIDVRSKKIVKIIAGMLVMAFLAQDIVWANPDTLQIPLITGTLRTDAVKALIEVKLQEIVRSIPLQELKERGYSLVLEERGEKFRIRFKTDAEGRLTAHCDPVTGQQKSHVFIVNDDLSTSEDKPFSPDVAKECSEEGDVLKYPHSDVAHGFMRTDGNGINLYIDVTDLFEGTAPSFKDKDVLVMGCGGGATCFKLALEGAGKVTGVDIDENSIAIAKTIAPYTRMPLLRNVLLRPQPSIGFEVMDILQTMENDPGALKGYEYSGPDTPEFITADARDLSCFQDNSFDYVVIPFMIGVLNGLQDEDVYYVIKEALRVTRPGGILYIEPFSRNVTEESEKLISRIIRLPLEQAVAFDILADIVSYLETDSINGKGLERVGGSSHSFVVKARPVDIVKKAPYEEDIVEHLYTENVAMVSTNISKEAETDFKGAKNLSEVLAMLPDRPLEVLDIGTGNGEFCDNLANMYPGRFRHIIGIDKMMGSSTENETGGAKISIRRNTSLEEFQNDKDNQNRFDIVFSNNTEIIRQHFAEILPKILKPGGIAILTFNWHMALTERYRAFETENSIHEFLDPIGSDIAGSMGLGSTAVANLDGYPDTLYTKIPGFIIIHRLPEGADLPETGDITSQPKPFAATENTERNEWKIVKKSLAGMAEELSDGLRSRLPASFREHFAVALRRVMSGIRDIEKPSPSDVYGLKKDLAMALRILNSTIAYKLSINSTQLKGMFTDDFVISSGLQSGIEASLAKNDFIPSYKDADGHAGQLEEIMHIDDALTSIHSRISWLSRVLESRENKAGSPDSAEPASIRQDFDVWTDSITYDISQLPYYSSEIQAGISVISGMYAHLLLNSYDAVIKRVESGEEYDYSPKIKIRVSLIDAGEGELVLRGSLEDNGTGISEAALQQLMEEKITTKSVQASDGTNQKISASDFGGVGLGVLNAISKLTISFPGRSSIVLTTEGPDGALIKMFDPSSGTSTISDIPESGNGRGTNIEINIKLAPGQNVEKGVIYESLWAPQSKPFAPDMAKEEPDDNPALEDKAGPKTDKGIYRYKKMLLILGSGLLLASFDINNYLYCGLAIRIPALAISLALLLTSAILYYKAGQSEKNKAGKDLPGVGGEDKPFPPDMVKEDKQDILHPAYVAYNMAQKDIINPDNKPLRAVYAGAGYDVTNLLQSTNARTACFVSDYSILSWNEFAMLEKEDYLRGGYKNDLDETYSHDKYDFGYIGGDLIKHKERAFDKYEHGNTFAKSLSVRKQMIAQLAYELHSLGVTKVKVDMYKERPRITFRWAYQGASEEEYSITFVTADITKPGKYPEALRNFLEEGIDVYFQKAGERIANDYSKKHDNFIIYLSKYLRQDGFFVTDDVAVRSVAGIFSGQPRYVNRAEKFPISLQVITNVDLERRKKEALAVRTKLPGRLNLGYGLIVTIRQADKVKTAVSGENDPVKNPRHSQDVERIAEEAYKKFEGICLEQIRLIREELRT
ncbi:MAG: methyltransferase domain-containing protein, partial [Candidatus Omnitrophota bacterium]